MASNGLGSRRRRSPDLAHVLVDIAAEDARGHHLSMWLTLGNSTAGPHCVDPCYRHPFAITGEDHSFWMGVWESFFDAILHFINDQYLPWFAETTFGKEFAH